MVMIAIQLFIIIVNDHVYQDSWKSWKANLFNDKTYISYNEFFSTQLFDKIKNDINYKGEIVAAVGYHPSILMYNKFNTADGYISVYPMKDALKFKELIQPELDSNEEINRYYTSWWGRRYLYNDDISYEPTRLKFNKKIELKLDMKVFTNYYNGKYILSRAEIANDEELNIELVNLYSNNDCIYEIFLYKIKS